MSYIIARYDKGTHRYAFYEDFDNHVNWSFFAGGNDDLKWTYSDTMKGIHLPRLFRDKKEANWYLNKYIEKQTFREKLEEYVEPYDFEIKEYLR